MGKATESKKKAKQKDFHKVKFKVGKKLPKNLNETRATFKAKTLILKQQFHLEKEGPVSHRNLSWKELLAHLGHHNQSIKMDAINSLREILGTKHAVLKNEMGAFLESLCPLFADRDYKVREAALQLFKAFVESVEDKKALEPFHGLLGVHLSCAMTNIVDNVQYSSLKLLDVLIERMPELVRSHAYAIFDNFINQISKAGLKGDKRTLKNDPYKLTSTQAWRDKVLSRLHRMLAIVARVNRDDPHPTSTKLFEFDGFRQCQVSFTEHHRIRPPTLKTCQRLSSKKSLTETREFFDTYFKVIAPLLVDCWIEAKPENKKVIESTESLSIMNSVLAILNLLLENLNCGVLELAKHIRASKGSSPVKHVEELFLANFPYSLSEGLDCSADAKKLSNGQANANMVNLLLCKFSASSMLEMSQEKVCAIFEYGLSALKPETTKCLLHAELQILVSLSETIFKNFSRIELIKPFLLSLVNYFDQAPKLSANKWLLFEFLCREFAENPNFFNKYENTLGVFYRKAVKLCMAYEKEKKEKVEPTLDWLRILLIRRGRTNKALAQSLADDYTNMLNAMDFESGEVGESAKKKLLELIGWLPRVDRYHFTKLSILILNKKISFFCVNQVLGILSDKVESSDGEQAFDESDFLMFLLGLFNGFSGFDLLNNCPTGTNEFYFIDIPKFQHHIKLCQHLEEFIRSQRDSDLLIDVLISSAIPILNRLPAIPCSTLYGTLCLVAQVKNMSLMSQGSSLVGWIGNAQFWAVQKLQWVQANRLGTLDEVNAQIDCLTKIIEKINEILHKQPKLVGEAAPTGFY